MSLIGVCLLLILLLQLLEGFWRIVDAYNYVDINMHHASTLADRRNHLMEEFRSNIKSDTAKKRLEYLDKLILSSLNSFNEKKFSLKMIFHKKHKAMLDMLNNNLNDMRKDFLRSTHNHKSTEYKILNEESGQDAFCNSRTMKDIPLNHVDSTFISDSNNVSSNQSVPLETNTTEEKKPLAPNFQFNRLMQWCSDGKLSYIQQLFTQYDCSHFINKLNERANDWWDGGTPLLSACYKGHFEVVKLLLQNGADVNIESIHGQTALMNAGYNGHVEIVRMLLEHGAEVNAQNNGGWTALMMASDNGHVKVVKLLIQHGADISLQRENGLTSLMLSCENSHMKVVKMLLEHDADVNIQCDKGMTALMYASVRAHEEIAKLLLDYGAEVNLIDKSGRTALIIARSSGRHVEFRLMLDST